MAEERARVEQVVSEIFVGRTVISIRSRLRHGGHQRSSAAAVLRAEAAAQHAELLERVGVRHGRGSSVVEIVVVAAVEQHIVVVAASSVYRNSVLLREADAGAGLVDGAGNQRLQL